VVVGFDVYELHINSQPVAATLVQEALRLSPPDTGACRWTHILGATKLVLGADAEAVVWLRRCLEANRNYPMAHFQLADYLGGGAVFGQDVQCRHSLVVARGSRST